MGTQTILQSDSKDYIITKLTIKSDLKLLNVVTSTVSSTALILGLSSEDITKLKDVLTEIFNNIVHEGYGCDNSQEVNITVCTRELLL